MSKGNCATSLDIPRDRNGDFRPAILPERYQHNYAQPSALVESRMVQGYSPQKLHHSNASPEIQRDSTLFAFFNRRRYRFKRDTLRRGPSSLHTLIQIHRRVEPRHGFLHS